MDMRRRMLQVCLGLLLMVVVTAGFAKHGLHPALLGVKHMDHAKTLSPSFISASMSLPLPPIHAVVIEGDLQVVLQPVRFRQANNYQLALGDEQRVQAFMQGDVLHLVSMPPQTKATMPTPGWPVLPAVVTVNVDRLNDLVVNGHSSVIAHGVAMPALQLVTATDGHIDLAGHIGLERLVAGGPAIIHVQNINTAQLRVVNTGNAVLDLSGRVRLMQANLIHQGQLDAQNLCADEVFVQTAEQAQARVCAYERLHAFAYDQSNIIYYHRPLHVSEYTSGAGNVLDVSARGDQ